MSSVTIGEYLTFGKDVVTTIAPVATFVVALLGLKTWKRQLKGQSEYELSKRMIVNILKYRDAIHSVRSPSIWPEKEHLPSTDERAAMSDAEIRYYWIEKAYQSKWANLLDKKVLVDVAAIEMEALWGDEIKSLISPIYSLERELWIALRCHLETMNPNVSIPRKQSLQAEMAKLRDIVYRVDEKNPDEYERELVNSIDKLILYIKPRLE